MARKGENIYKRKDGRWEGRYIKISAIDGKKKYGYVYGKSYKEVKEKLLKVRVAREQERIGGNESNATFTFYSAKWFSSLSPDIKESTKNKYQNLLDLYITPNWDDKRLSDIDFDFIDSFCNGLLSSGGKKGLGLSPKTVSDVLSVIRSVLRYCKNKGEYVPCDGTSVIIKQRPKQMRVLSRSEQSILCEYIAMNRSPENLGILLCLFTGLRIGELCALQWGYISFSEQVLYVRHTLQRIQDKKGKGTKIVITQPKSVCSLRSIPIPASIMSLLEDNSLDRQCYFLTNTAEQFLEPRIMQYRFKRVLAAASIGDANFHALRHTFATRCIEAGFDVKTLSEILGHANVSITMNRYVHPSIDLKKQNMDKLSPLFAVS